MSASTNKKNRIAARADGTDKKTLAAQKEAEKKRKDTIKWSIIAAVVFVFFVAILFLDSGMFYRNSAAYTVDIPEYQGDDFTIAEDSVDFSISEVNYLYRFNYSQFVNQYGSYASVFGLDTSKPLKSQPCSMTGEEGYTWHDYFMDSTENQLKNYAVTMAYAKAAGIELSEDDRTAIEEAVTNLKDGAKENGYKSINKFLTANYGKGCNEQLFRDILEMEYTSMAVQETIMNAKDFSAQEIKDYYASIADDYDSYSYSYYLVEAETVAAADGTTAAPTEEAMAAAKETAEQIKSAAVESDLEAAIIEVCGIEAVPVHDEETEGEAEEGHVHTASTTLADVEGRTIVADIADWLKSADRQAGDIEVIEAADKGSYVVIFTERHTVTETTEESDGVPYCDYIAEQLLRNDEFNNWTEAVYNKIAEGVTAETKFSARYVG